jgi:HEAT repeat protein
MIRRRQVHPTKIVRVTSGPPEYPPDPAAIRVIQVLLRDPNRFVRQECLRWLADLKRAALPALPDILAALQDPDSRVRLSATFVLAALGPTGEATALALRKRFDDPDLQVRHFVAVAYHKLTGDADLAAQVVIPLLREDSVNAQAVNTVGRLGPAARDAVPILVEMFNERREQRTYNPAPVAKALGGIGPCPRQAVPSLRRALDDNHWVRLEAAIALWRIGERDEAIVAAIRTVLKENDGSVRFKAIKTLDKHEDLARLLLPELRQLDNNEAALQLVRRIEQSRR